MNALRLVDCCTFYLRLVWSLYPHRLYIHYCCGLRYVAVVPAGGAPLIGRVIAGWTLRLGDSHVPRWLPHVVAHWRP